MSNPNEIKIDPQPADESAGSDSAAAVEDAEAGDAVASVELQAAADEAEAPEPDLAQRLRIAEDTAQQHFNEMLRARAEVDNVRKRGQRDLERARKYALERIMGDMLEVRDSLERAQEAGADEAATVAHLREGTALTLKLLTQVLAKHGLTEVDPLGERFNPELHEAISVFATEEHEPDTVVQVVQKGYLLNDRLIRAARVVVAAAPG